MTSYSSLYREDEESWEEAGGEELYRHGSGTDGCGQRADASGAVLPLNTEADHVAGCARIEARREVGFEVLRKLNPDIDHRCTNLRLGYWYCIAGQFLLQSRENGKWLTDQVETPVYLQILLTSASATIYEIPTVGPAGRPNRWNTFQQLVGCSFRAHQM